MLIFITMIVLGLLVGFIGAGGAGFVIAILTTVFGVPVHTAFGTSLSAMVFTSISGTYSHFRENNLVLRVGLDTGLFGAIGAFFGSWIADLILGSTLKWFTAGMMIFSAVLLWFRLFTKYGQLGANTGAQEVPSGISFWIAACGVGFVTGGLSGLLGIGASPFIQIGLLIFFGLSVQQAAGTTMLVILPVAFVGGVGYYTAGNWDILLFIEVAAGMIIGSYVGAKFTSRLHPMVLKVTLIAVPIVAAIVLII